MQNKNSFLGKGWAFPPEFSHNDNPTRMSNYEEDIRQTQTRLPGAKKETSTVFVRSAGRFISTS